MPLVLGACIPCHSAEMVAQQRLDPATWEAIVDRMITYGAPITPETKPLILQYLATGSARELELASPPRRSLRVPGLPKTHPTSIPRVSNPTTGTARCEA
jgi:hypothetical protein